MEFVHEKEKIQAGLAEYNASVEKTVARFPERGHLPEQRLYTPLDIEGTDYTEEIGFPGMYPYTRGVQPTMYIAKSTDAGALIVIEVETLPRSI